MADNAFYRKAWKCWQSLVCVDGQYMVKFLTGWSDEKILSSCILSGTLEKLFNTKDSSLLCCCCNKDALMLILAIDGRVVDIRGINNYNPPGQIETDMKNKFATWSNVSLKIDSHFWVFRQIFTSPLQGNPIIYDRASGVLGRGDP